VTVYDDSACVTMNSTPNKLVYIRGVLCYNIRQHTKGFNMTKNQILKKLKTILLDEKNQALCALFIENAFANVLKDDFFKTKRDKSDEPLLASDK
jgi:hypothetical protein